MSKLNFAVIEAKELPALDAGSWFEGFSMATLVMAAAFAVVLTNAVG